MKMYSGWELLRALETLRGTLKASNKSCELLLKHSVKSPIDSRLSNITLGDHFFVSLNLTTTPHYE